VKQAGSEAADQAWTVTPASPSTIRVRQARTCASSGGILPFACLRRLCVAKLSLDRQPQHFYHHLYIVKMMWSAECRKISASKSSKRQPGPDSAEGLRCPLRVAHSVFSSDDRSSNKNDVDQTPDMPNALGGSGLSANGGCSPTGLHARQSSSAVWHRKAHAEDLRNFNSRSADGRATGSHAQAVLPKFISIRLFD
jgi:hypothetical protein